MATGTATKHTNNTDFLRHSDMTFDEIRNKVEALRRVSDIMLTPGEKSILAMLVDVIETVDNISNRD